MFQAVQYSDIVNKYFSKVSSYLQIVVAHRTLRCWQVIVHTLPEAAQTGRIGGGAGLWARWRFEQQTAWTGGVLARALARFLLQRHKPTEQKIQIPVKNAAWTDRERGREGGKVLSSTFSFSHLAEQTSDGLAWQYSLVHSGRQLSGSCGLITAQNTFKHLMRQKKVQFKRCWIYVKCIIYFFFSWAATKHKIL